MALIGAFAASSAWAQDAQSADKAKETGVKSTKGKSVAEIEEVVVTGVRASLQSAQQIKQSSDIVVDSITAEDIGALPDRSVTEALQRVPGVAINRFAAGRDPDHFSVEGSGVVVRGLTYVRSEVNGRDAFTANNGRGLSFADVPSELLGGVDVYKSPSADQTEGGIAGIVNLRTRKPFDSSKSIFAFSAEANYGDFVKKTTPTLSGLFSHRWETGAGEFGILGSAVYSQLKSRADRYQISNFSERTLYESGNVISEGAGDDPVGSVYFPRGAVAGTQDFNRKRIGISGALQWRSNDETMEATFQYLRSDAREKYTEHTLEIATDNVTNNGDSRRVPGTELTFDDNGVFDSGVITGPTGWRSDQFSDPRTPDMALQSNNIRRDNDSRNLTNDYSFNFKWDATDRLAFNLDLQHVNSRVDVDDHGMWMTTYQNAMIDLDGKNVPDIAFVPPTVCTAAPSNNCPQYFNADHASYADPYNSFYRAAMDHFERSAGNSDSAKLDVEYNFPESDWLSSIKAGYRFSDRDQTARYSTYNWGALSEQWGNNGPVWLDDPVDGIQGGSGGSAPQGYEVFNMDNFFRGKVENPLGADGRLFYNMNMAENYDEYVAYANEIAKEWAGTPAGSSGGWLSLANRPGVVAGTPFLPSELNPVREKNNAAYFMVRFAHDMDNGGSFSGNVGLRYTDTKRTASGFQSFQQITFTSDAACDAQPADQKSAFCALPVNVRHDAAAYANGAATAFQAKLKYHYWLPSVNLKLDVGNGVQFRGAYGKGISLPDFGLTRAYYNVNLQTNADDIEAGGGKPVGRFNAGNPYLKPVVSDNFDLTAEWYFSKVGQLSGAVFFKSLKGIRTNDIQRLTFTNNGASFDAIVTTPVNSTEKGKIKGFELAYQQTYDFLPGFLSGLGVNANYTYVKSSNVPQSTLSETDPDVGAGNQATVDISKLPLEGLSKHTVNFTTFYEKGPISARVAYSWRSKFLLTIRDVIVPYQPIMNEATGQLDGSIFYSINDNFKVGIQGVNLLNETIKTSAVLNDNLLTAPRGWFMNDRRFSLILRGNF